MVSRNFCYEGFGDVAGGLNSVDKRNPMKYIQSMLLEQLQRVDLFSATCETEMWQRSTVQSGEHDQYSCRAFVTSLMALINMLRLIPI